MEIQIITIANKMPAWVDTGYNDYARRLPRDIQLKLTTIPVPSRKGNAAIEKLKKQEADAIRKAIPRDSRTLALDENGRQWSSRDWSDRLKNWLMDSPRVNLVIGGPDGLDTGFAHEANDRISLGKMTLPHGLVRVVLAEQIYRAWSLLKGHPYHRD